MEKRTILAIILCLGIWLIWQALFIEPVEQRRGGAADGGNQGVGEAAGATDRPRDRQTEKTDSSASIEKQPANRPEEQLVRIKNDLYEAVWSTRGASLKSFILADYLEREKSKASKEVTKENLVSAEGELAQPFTIRFRGEKTDFKLKTYTDWAVTSTSPDGVSFRYTDPEDKKTPEIIKTYTISPEKYVMELKVEVANRTEGSFKEQIILETFAGYQEMQATGCMAPQSAPRKPVCMVNNELLDVEPKPGNGKSGDPAVLWTGINEQYFLIAAIAMGVEKAVCKIEASHEGVISSSLMYPETVIPPGGTVVHRFRLFAGPKRLDLLDRVKGGAANEQGEARLNASVDFGWLGFLCYPMLWLLKIFYKLAGNYGIAIVFLTIVVKLLLLPLTQKSMKSMRDMAKLKPMMEELRKKYGSDKQRLNQETMNLYKAHKINPMGGCFPMLLQMPIWIALYRMLYSAVELYQTKFISGWIDDLSYRDPYFIMPIVLGVAMFLQQKLSPSSADTQQAKMMLYAMPIFFTFIMLYLPSGLVLYIFVNSILSIGHQLFYNRLTGAPTNAGVDAKATAAG